MESLENAPSFKDLYVCILIGSSNGDSKQCEQADLVNEYGKMDNAAEMKNVLERLGCGVVRICIVTLDNYLSLLDELEGDTKGTLVLLNLLDGVETDGYPGASVVLEIEKRGIPFTGSNSYFYQITTSKPQQKAILQKHGVTTAPFVEIIPGKVNDSITQATDTVGFPMIVKPSISYASLGIYAASVVHNPEQCTTQIQTLFSQFDQVFVEQYLPGREFTVLITGDTETGLKRYPAVERRFDENVPVEERFLAWEKYWAGYGLHSTERSEEMPREEFCEYVPAPECIQTRLLSLGEAAYVALGGNGYGRVDIRADSFDLMQCGLFVLEVNANPGLSFGVSSSIGKILEHSNEAAAEILSSMLSYALLRNQAT